MRPWDECQRMPMKKQRNNVDFPYAIRSFVGYLEGTHKSIHTIKNYRLDILAFQDFITREYTQSPIRLDELSHKNIERYREHLKERGLKVNTRRRKLLTVTQFLNYLSKRNKIGPEMAQKIATPHKIERIPFTVSSQRLVEAIQKLPDGTLLESRNRVLLWALAEMGCLVSEVVGLRFEQWSLPSCDSDAGIVQIRGKFQREVPTSLPLYFAVEKLKLRSKDCPWIFLGFNRHGPLGSPITVRGVEMLVQFYGPKLGFADLTPRTFRHSIILHWFEKGLTELEIQARLGLKTTYAFRSYAPLLKSKMETTSKLEKNSMEFLEPQE